MGSPAAKNTPPPASRVHMMIASHLKVLISGSSSPPTLALAAGETATPMPMKKVSSSRSWK